MTTTNKNVGRMSFTHDGKKRTNTYLTPKPLLLHVYACLGLVDLDPCSNSQLYPQVRAERHYSENEDGLQQEWCGRIFCNPPYGTVSKWVDKFLGEYNVGHMSEGILLVASSTETKWFQRLCDARTHICFLNKRLWFDAAPGIPCPEQARFSSVLFYVGYRSYEFRLAFQELGAIR